MALVALVASLLAVPQLILWAQSTPDAAGVASNAAAVNNITRAAAVDGFVIRGDSFSMTTCAAEPLNVSAVRAELQLLKKSASFSASDIYVLVHVMPSGLLAEWPATVGANFATLAAACKEAEVAGIFFDVEDYTHKAWHPEYICPESCPAPCLPTPPAYNGSGCPESCLGPCRAAAVAAGEGVMRAMLAADPSVRLLTSHGPWLSDNRTASYMEKTMPGFENGQNWAKDNPIVGSFDIGLMAALDAAHASSGGRGGPRAASASARYLDGSEIYMQSTPTDVQRMRDWIKLNMSTSPLVPATLRARYSQLETFSPGVYDFPKAYHGTGPGTPQMWQNDLTISLRGTDPDGLTWAYSEAFDWFGLGYHATGKKPVPAEWVAATARARAAARDLHDHEQAPHRKGKF
jgi:hypothetical protein